MAGLVAYESSDEDEDTQVASSEAQETSKAIEESTERRTDTNHLDQSENDNTSHKKAANNRAPVSLVAPQAPIEGPTLGPTIPQDAQQTSPLPEEIRRDDSAPQSPYTANRALLRELTMPSVPSLDIPPSPPGSPPPGPNAKFAHFLELKKQGVHFNEKLAKSSALKNPSLMQKLMDFADINEVGQYATTLPLDLWDPNVFPKVAYKEELAKSQQKILKNREEEIAMGNRTAVEFVPGAASGDSSRSGTPVGLVGRSVPKSAAERVMAGLDGGRSNSPQLQAGSKRKHSRFDT